MFVSVTQLHRDMGVDEEIARFFVDRKVPENNAFWEGRLLYIGRGNGFKNIPVYFDILFRIGVPKNVLLEETHVQFMEQVMHFAIQHEKELISFKEQLQKISAAAETRIQQPGFYHELVNYLDQDVLMPVGRLGIRPPALNRADAFLFVLCDIPITEKQLDDAIRYWYALHPTYLLMDDIHDYKKDKEKSEENAVMELGEDQIGFEKAFEVIGKNIAELQKINPALAQTMESHLDELHNLVE